MSCGGGGFGAPSDTITGTLTPGVIPVATGIHTLGDSIISQAAGVISIAGALSVLAGDLLVSRSSAGIVLGTIANTNGAATGHAVLSLDSTAGDGYLRIDTSWALGKDVSDSSAFVLSQSSTLGTNNRIRVDSSAVLLPTTDLTISRSSAGIVLGSVINTNGAATGHAVMSLDSTAGDAFVRIDSQWSFGRDVSDSGAWVLSKSGTLGTTNVLRVDASSIISPNSLVVTNFSEVCNSAGSSAPFYWSSGTFTSTSRRWRARKDNTAESGANAGSDWQLEAFTDGAVLIDAPIKIFRVAGGNMELARPVKLAGVLITAAANESTGAGAALLGANSPAATLAAPYTWIKWNTSDGSVVYMPVWK
jgi:hypothetical protein